ncbi:OstA-like protein [Marinilabiliaceae bacterium ANBcel2]|nr:OstA-like protein [Marinilabiliaceae bacterium ANBcel2]
MRFFLVLSAALLLVGFIVSSSGEREATTIHIDHADYMERSERFKGNVQALFGDVKFRHHQTVMHCDSAFFDRDSNHVHAYGSIHVIQDDSIHLYGDILYYYGNRDLAEMRDNVKMVNGDIVLTTQHLDYDRRKDVAYYFNGGQIESPENVLTSEKAYYYPRTEEAHFQKDVVLVNPDYKILSDTLLYYTIPEIVKITGPTRILSDDNLIYAESGFYDTQNDIARLEKNSYIEGKEQTLSGDTIYYDRNSGFGEVFSRMVMRDTTNHVIIKGNYGYYNEISQKALATDSALLLQISASDTLFLHADTLRSDPIPDTDFQMLRAYRNVKFFRQDFQGRCDSMVYSLKDSINSFYYDPVIWAHHNQLSADEIHLYTRENQLYKAELIQNSFVIAPEGTDMYNQIKGNNMTGYIKDNQLYRIDVDGSGQTIYYPKEDEHIIGVNRAESSNMTIHLEDQQVTGITLRTHPDGRLNPVFLVSQEETRLSNFRWLDEFRPKQMSDIFIRHEKQPEPVDRIDYSEFHFDR